MMRSQWQLGSSRPGAVFLFSVRFSFGVGLGQGEAKQMTQLFRWFCIPLPSPLPHCLTHIFSHPELSTSPRASPSPIAQHSILARACALARLLLVGAQAGRRVRQRWLAGHHARLLAGARVACPVCGAAALFLQRMVDGHAAAAGAN